MFQQARFTRSLAAAVLFAGAASLTSGAAIAQEQPVIVQADPADIRSELVSYTSFNLAHAKDQKALRGRVEGAIERVCQIDLGRDGLQDKGFYLCQANARADASEQIDAAVSKAVRLTLMGRPAVFAGSVAVTAK